MEIKAAEISSVIKDQIANFETKADVAEVGTVSVSYTHLTLPTTPYV